MCNIILGQSTLVTRRLFCTLQASFMGLKIWSPQVHLNGSDSPRVTGGPTRPGPVRPGPGSAGPGQAGLEGRSLVSSSLPSVPLEQCQGSACAACVAIPSNYNNIAFAVSPCLLFPPSPSFLYLFSLVSALITPVAFLLTLGSSLLNLPVLPLLLDPIRVRLRTSSHSPPSQVITSNPRCVADHRTQKLSLTLSSSGSTVMQNSKSSRNQASSWNPSTLCVAGG